MATRAQGDDMNALIPDAWAQGAPPAGGGQLQFAVLMGLMLVVFYFMLIRPQQKKAREHQTLVSKLASGDEVVTSGGILGRIVEVGDSFVTLEIADAVRIKVQKFQIAQLMPKGTLKNA
jgi:preprotein translocase subunit YajC